MYVSSFLLCIFLFSVMYISFLLCACHLFCYVSSIFLLFCYVYFFILLRERDIVPW